MGGEPGGSRGGGGRRGLRPMPPTLAHSPGHACGRARHEIAGRGTQQGRGERRGVGQRSHAAARRGRRLAGKGGARHGGSVEGGWRGNGLLARLAASTDSASARALSTTTPPPTTALLQSPAISPRSRYTLARGRGAPRGGARVAAENCPLGGGRRGAAVAPQSAGRGAAEGLGVGGGGGNPKGKAPAKIGGGAERAAAAATAATPPPPPSVKQPPCSAAGPPPACRARHRPGSSTRPTRAESRASPAGRPRCRTGGR